MIRAISLALLASPACAEPVCLDRQDMIATLDEQFSERQAVVAQINPTAALEAYVSPRGTWTLTTAVVDGDHWRSCIIASGTGWHMVAAGVAG